MGRDVVDRTVTPEDRQRHRRKIQQCLDALARMLDRSSFSDRRCIGLEMELNLVDAEMAPAMANAVVLEKINDPTFQTELGQHNIEVNLPPRPIEGDCVLGLEAELRSALNSAEGKAGDAGARLVMTGILPTLRRGHFELRWLSPKARYRLLNEQIMASRGEEILIDLEGVPLADGPPERLLITCDSIAFEAACTSAQLHLQVAPEEFAAHWNAAQCLAGVQVALAANSPFLLGRALWHETRTPLFLQATDIRPPELRNQGVRPRVFFGERWISSVFELFEENVRYFPPLLPETEEEDPLAELAAGHASKLDELMLHNSTIWRWNRPIYAVVDDVPHLRVENRVLPAGPTVIDVIANAAFFYGALRTLAGQERPVWSQMSFTAAEENLYAGARHGMNAHLYWPGLGWARPDELVLRVLLPMAHEGLRRCGVSAEVRDRYLGVIERRCAQRCNGATWQRDAVAALEQRGADRDTALTGMLERYLEHMHSNEPVHAWPAV